MVGSFLKPCLLYTSFAIAVGTDFALILAALHLGVLGALGLDAVSYTHLDVYKRQEVERSRRVLDGSVTVMCAKGGVEPQSETCLLYTSRCV